MKFKETHKPAKPAGISEKVIRLLEIYAMIAQRQYPSVVHLMTHFGVTQRTIYRYLELINMIDSIELDKERNGYIFTHGDRTKKQVLNDEELITLFTAGQALNHLGPPFRESFQKLLGRMFTFTGKETAEDKLPIVLKTPDAILDRKLESYLMTISLCMKEKRAVSMSYQAHGAKKSTERIVDPYGLVFYDGVWFLIGYCHLRKELRNFALDRIIDIKDRWLYFEPREDFDLDEYLAASWGIIHGEEEVGITVRFRAEIADYILRKEKWHTSEQRTILPDGAVELSFIVAGVDEIKRWIYSWLPNVEVMKPAWLRRQIKKELSRYASDHT